MCDLHQTCEAMGLDSNKLRPIAHATPEGRVAVYIGAAWQALPLGKAINLRDQLTRAIAELRPPADPPSSDAPEPYDVQLRHWREGRIWPRPDLSPAAAAEIERDLMDALKQENQP